MLDTDIMDAVQQRKSEGTTMEPIQGGKDKGLSAELCHRKVNMKGTLKVDSGKAGALENDFQHSLDDGDLQRIQEG